MCRHGSPAPNTRPIGGSSGVRGTGVSNTTGRQHILAGSPAAGRSQQQQVSQSGSAGSVSSLGSGIVGSGAVGAGRYSARGSSISCVYFFTPIFVNFLFLFECFVELCG